MKVLCEVHISFKVCKFLNENGFYAIHINDILDKSETKDSENCNYANANDFIVITKDIDFKNSFLLNQTPQKLIKINLGNISNLELIKILKNKLELIVNLYKKNNFMLEIDKDQINYIKI